MDNSSGYRPSKEFYFPLSNFINIFLAVLFSLSFKEFYSNFSNLFDYLSSLLLGGSGGLSLNESVLSKFLLIFTTLVFFIDDGIEAQLLTINYFPYKRLRRFYLDLIIYNLFYISIILADKLSKFYFLSISFIFILFYFWSKYSIEEHILDANKYIKLIKLIKETCVFGFLLFFSIFIIIGLCNIDISIKIVVYSVILLLIYYFIYDILGELLLDDLEFKGTGIFKPIIHYFKRKICAKI